MLHDRTRHAACFLDARGFNCEAVSPTLWLVTFPDGHKERLFSRELIALARKQED
jgi:hypothetical protein